MTHIHRRIPEHVRGVFGRLTELPGVGPVREARLERLGIRSVRDLLFLIPRRLERWEGESPIAAVRARMGASVRIRGRVVSSRFLRTGRRRSLLRVAVEDRSGRIDVLFFNQPWLRQRFTKGEELEARGRVVDAKGPALVASRIGGDVKPLPQAGEIETVYPRTEGVSQGLLKDLCRAASARYAEKLEEPLNAKDLAALGLPPLPEAAFELHHPTSEEGFARATRRVALEPILALQARVWDRRQRRGEGRALVLELSREQHRELASRLPFELTAGQHLVLGELRADLARSVPMRRLLQGDVGSGKTVVGLWACMAAAAAGAQSAFMAPTELLAEQHFEGLRRLFPKAGLRAALLTGSLKLSDRRKVLADLERGAIDLAFGTHALFSEDVRFHRLAVAVIDEQHRFGVAQRRLLLEKGRDVHALLMTATPIPRSLALTVYGDLDLSILREKPPGRGEVRTRWLRGPEKRRLIERLEGQLEAGEQVYWVVPRIESADDGVEESTGAEARYADLTERPLERFGIELVHGRMPSPERSQRLERFRAGEARLLVATTVIEVGVDVPAATVMVIEAAERLGLSQLHQLRGRIGRGARESHCLILGKPSAHERFELLERTTDGFEIAEEDLRRRGMGDLAGLRQSGDAPILTGDPERDVELLLFARDLVARDEGLRRSYLAAAPEDAAV